LDFEKKPITDDDVHKQIDNLVENSHPEQLREIRENRAFLKQTEEEPLPEKYATVKAFGKNVNINAILKINFIHRSIFTVDELCEMFLAMTIEQLIKFQKKKRGISFDLGWLLVLLIGVPLGIGVLIMLLR